MVDAEQIEAVLNNGVGDSMLCMKSGDRLYIPEPVDVVSDDDRLEDEDAT